MIKPLMLDGLHLMPQISKRAELSVDEICQLVASYFNTEITEIYLQYLFAANNADCLKLTRVSVAERKEMKKLAMVAKSRFYTKCDELGVDPEEVCRIHSEYARKKFEKTLLSCDFPRQVLSILTGRGLYFDAEFRQYCLARKFEIPEDHKSFEYHEICRNLHGALSRGSRWYWKC